MFLLAFVDMTVYNFQQHSYNFELSSCITSSARRSSNLASTDILHKEQVCLQLGVRPNFRNKWSRGQHWWDWGRFNSICCESLTWQLAGEPFPTTLQAVWELKRQIAKEKSKAGISNRTCSREENHIAWRSIWKHWGDPYLETNWQRHWIKVAHIASVYF